MDHLKKNGVQHTRASPYHPATNAETERFVRTFKEAMKTIQSDGLMLPHAPNQQLHPNLLNHSAHDHRDPILQTPYGTQPTYTGDLLKPSTDENVRRRQTIQKSVHDQHAWWRCMSIGDSVMVRNFSAEPDWAPGVVAQILGPLTYLIDILDDRLWKRYYVDHIKKCGQFSNRSVVAAKVEFDVDTQSISSEALTVLDTSETHANEPLNDPTNSSDTNNAETDSSEPVETSLNLELRSEIETTDSSQVEPLTCPDSETLTLLPGIPRHSYPSRSHCSPDRYGY